MGPSGGATEVSKSSILELRHCRVAHGIQHDLLYRTICSNFKKIYKIADLQGHQGNNPILHASVLHSKAGLQLAALTCVSSTLQGLQAARKVLQCLDDLQVYKILRIGSGAVLAGDADRAELLSGRVKQGSSVPQSTTR